MKLWTSAEMRKREQQVIEKCAQIAYDYGAPHWDRTNTAGVAETTAATAVATSNSIGRAIEAFGRIVADEWKGEETSCGS